MLLLSCVIGFSSVCCFLSIYPQSLDLLEILEISAEAAFIKALSIAPSAGHVQTMNGLQPFLYLFWACSPIFLPQSGMHHQALANSLYTYNVSWCFLALSLFLKA
jgi:hypothetical protein